MRPNKVRDCRLMCFFLLLLAMTEPAFSAGLAGSEWRPVRIGDGVMSDATGIFVRFEAGNRLSGHAGCNRFFGSYEITGDRIRVGPLGTTRMACAASAMELESVFLNTLEAAKGFVRDATRLTLMDENGNSSVEFIQTDWD